MLINNNSEITSELIEFILNLKNISQVMVLKNKVIQISTNYTLKNHFELFTIYLYLKDNQWVLSDFENTCEDFLYSSIKKESLIKNTKRFGFELINNKIEKKINLNNLENEIENFISFAKKNGYIEKILLKKQYLFIY